MIKNVTDCMTGYENSGALFQRSSRRGSSQGKLSFALHHKFIDSSLTLRTHNGWPAGHCLVWRPYPVGLCSKRLRSLSTCVRHGIDSIPICHRNRQAASRSRDGSTRTNLTRR
jgi:hypothetical protein